MSTVSPIPRSRRTKAPPVIPAAILDSDVANGRRLARRHGDSIRYTVERSFMCWDGRPRAAECALQQRTAVSIEEAPRGHDLVHAIGTGHPGTVDRLRCRSMVVERCQRHAGSAHRATLPNTFFAAESS